MTELPSPIARRPRGLIWALAGVVVVVALLIVIVFLLLPRSSNASACDSYAKTYNRIADAVKLKLGSDIIRSFVTEAPAEFATSSNDAHGNVRVVMTKSADLSLNWISASNDQGVAFLLSAEKVAEACKADGAPITLNNFK